MCLNPNLNQNRSESVRSVCREIDQTFGQPLKLVKVNDSSSYKKHSGDGGEINYPGDHIVTGRSPQRQGTKKTSLSKSKERKSYLER